jgi:thioredoxin-related protein
MEKKETKKLFLLLYIMLGLLVINTCFVIFDNGTTKTDNTKEEETTDDYDVSSFNAIDETGFLETVNKSTLQVIYLGRATCGYCVQFLPTMKEAQDKLGYTTNYVDITAVDTSSEDYTKMTTMINNMTETFNKEHNYTGENAYEYLYGYTPMFVLAKNGKIVDVWVGYSDYATFAAWLNENGIK